MLAVHAETVWDASIATGWIVFMAVGIWWTKKQEKRGGKK